MLGNIVNASKALEAAVSLLEKTWPVNGLLPETLRSRLENNNNGALLLFDTRSEDEYLTSHLKRAEHLDPGTKPEVFLNRYGTELPDKDVVFYCSVGQRSSELLQKLSGACRGSGATGCYNLSGGIFRWYNMGYPVYNENGETDDIHGYNAMWEMMIERRKKSR